MNKVFYYLTSYFSKIMFHVALPSTIRSPKKLLRLCFPTKILFAFLVPHIHAALRPHSACYVSLDSNPLAAGPVRPTRWCYEAPRPHWLIICILQKLRS